MVEDLKNMTVRALRELAREHIGPGFSRYKTKGELVEALGVALSSRQVAPAVPSTEAPPRSPDVAQRAQLSFLPLEERPTRDAAPGDRNGRGMESAPHRHGESISAGSPKKERGAEPRVAEAAIAYQTSNPKPAKVELRALQGAHPEEAPNQTIAQAPQGKTCADASENGGETCGAAPAFDEGLGELPDSYEEDSVALLPKGPYALYLYWDFSKDTIAAALDFRAGAVTCLRLYAGERLVRELECALDARSWYFHGLQPGLCYRAELVAVAPNGETYRIGPASNPVQLPADAPSPLIDDRFVRLPFDLPQAGFGPALQRETTGAVPPVTRSLRALLYRMSGGSARALGSSNLSPITSPGVQSAPSDAELTGELDWNLRRGAGPRSTGPWSGTLSSGWGGRLPSSDTLMKGQTSSRGDVDPFQEDAPEGASEVTPRTFRGLPDDET